MSAWFLLIVSVLSGTAGDLLNAKSMRDHGEANKHLIFQLAAATVDRGRVPFRV